MKASEFARIETLGMLKGNYEALCEIQLNYLQEEQRAEIMQLRKDYRYALQRIEPVIETVITEDDT